MPRPMPREPPVTTATRPCREKSSGIMPCPVRSASALIRCSQVQVMRGTEHDAEQRAAAGKAVDEHNRPGRVERSRGQLSAATAAAIGIRQAGNRRNASRARRTATRPRRQRAPATPDSPSAPLIDVMTVRDAAEQRGQRRGLRRIERRRRVRRGIDHVDILRRQPGIVERQPSSCGPAPRALSARRSGARRRPRRPCRGSRRARAPSIAAA